MSFLLDVVLIVLLLVVAWIYANRSIFAAAASVIAALIAIVAAVLLTGVLSAPLCTHVVAPLTEQVAANEFADMYSAPHLSGGRETVAALPLGELVAEEPEAYRQLLDRYAVSAEEVAAAYEASPLPETVLVTVTAPFADALSRAAVFVLLSVTFTLVLQIVWRQIEQNFPPRRRYRGFKRLVPWLIGLAGGLLWCWVAAAVISWLVPTLAGRSLWLTPEVLAATDWYSLLKWTDPFLLLMQLMG